MENNFGFVKVGKAWIKISEIFAIGKIKKQLNGFKEIDYFYFDILLGSGSWAITDLNETALSNMRESLLLMLGIDPNEDSSM